MTRDSVSNSGLRAKGAALAGVRSPAARALVGWFAAWLVLTVLGTALHWGTWIAPAEDPPVPTVLGSGASKHVANFMAIPSAPGWVVVAKVGQGVFGLDLWVTGHSVLGAAIANGGSWVVWLTLLAAGWRARKWLAARGRTTRVGLSQAAGSVGTSAEQENRGDSHAVAALDPPPSAVLSRRALLANSLFAGAGLAGSGSVAYGSVVAPFELRVARYRVPIADLPPGLDGYRIVQVTDTHLGPRVPAALVEQAMELALSLRPDLLALTGDYVHNGFYQIAPAVELFAKYLSPAAARVGAAPPPVVAVRGNHDWYAGGGAMADALELVGIRVIDRAGPNLVSSPLNAGSAKGARPRASGGGRVFVSAHTRALCDELDAGVPGICIAGVGDLQQDRVDFAGALKGVPVSMPRILLSHNPDAAEDPWLLGPEGQGSAMPAAARRVDLMLCGHTHGGQVSLPLLGPPIVPSQFGQKYAHGLNAGPACRVITSAGVGMSLIPLRLGVPPEVVEVTLVRAER